MAATIECTLEVPLAPLRQALSSVVVHAEPTKTGDEVSDMSRVRLTAAASELYVLAANDSGTAALAAVPIETDSRAERFAADDGEFSVDITPGAARLLLRDFRAGKPGVEADQDMVKLLIGETRITVSDASGLLKDSFGLEVSQQLLQFSTDYPDVHDILRQALARAGEAQAAKPLVTQGKLWALFRHAAVAYGRPLRVEGVGSSEQRGFVVMCGTAFIGAVTSRHNDDDSLAKAQAERRAHLERLGLQPALAGL